MGDMADWVVRNIVDVYDEVQDGDTAGIEFEAKVIASTNKALLVEVGKNRSGWIPKSVLNENDEINQKSKEGDKGVLVLPFWLVERKDWV